MEWDYIVEYTDDRLVNPNKIITVRTANIKAWIGNFEHNDKHVKVNSFKVKMLI